MVSLDFVIVNEYKTNGIVVAKISIHQPRKLEHLSSVALVVENALYDPLAEPDFKPIRRQILQDSIRQYMDHSKIASEKLLTAQWKYTLGNRNR